MYPNSPRHSAAPSRWVMSADDNAREEGGVWPCGLLRHQLLVSYSAPVPLPEVPSSLCSWGLPGGGCWKGWREGDRLKSAWRMKADGIAAEPGSCLLSRAACARAPACPHHPLLLDLPFLPLHPCRPPHRYQPGVAVAAEGVPGCAPGGTQMPSARRRKTWAGSTEVG